MLTKMTRSLILVMMLCLGGVTLMSLADFHQASLASCEPPPSPPKKSTKK